MVPKGNGCGYVTVMVTVPPVPQLVLSNWKADSAALVPGGNVPIALDGVNWADAKPHEPPAPEILAVPVPCEVGPE